MTQTNATTKTEQTFQTRAERLMHETGHPEEISDILGRCDRSGRDELASDISHLINELSVTQFGLTHNWLDMPNRSGEEAYELMMAFRAGMALAATTDEITAFNNTTVEGTQVTIDAE